MPTPVNRTLTLELSPLNCDTIAASLNALVNYSPEHSARFSFIHDSLYPIVSKPCAYITMAESNYIKLADALITAELLLGCSDMEWDSAIIRRRIYQLLAY